MGGSMVGGGPTGASGGTAGRLWSKGGGGGTTGATPVMLALAEEVTGILLPSPLLSSSESVKSLEEESEWMLQSLCTVFCSCCYYQWDYEGCE